MTEPGGTTTQSGILFQNSIAALYLGQMIDTRRTPSSQPLIAVRLEAPEHVDDIVVTFADGVRLLIQVKENLTIGSAPWTKFWKDALLQSRKVEHAADTFLLVLGNYSDDFDDLREMCERCQGKESEGEWRASLNRNHSKLAGKIAAAAELPESEIFELVQRVSVEFRTLKLVETIGIRDNIPPSSASPQTLFSILRDACGGAARVRKTFDREQLTRLLARQEIDLDDAGARAGLFRELNVVSIDSAHDVRIGQVVQQIASRFPYLRNDHAVSTERFIRDQQRASFSGRSGAFHELDNWLFGSGNRPNLLLHGPAGRGKSALLVHWLATLRTNTNCKTGIIFVPINRRHELAKDFDFFAALATSIAPFLPDEMTFPGDIEQMRGFSHRALKILSDNQIPLLIVIDGLDEADGWAIGPNFFPERQRGHPLRILVSARGEADEPSGRQWCRRLGWDSDASVLQLDRLNDQEVRTLLTRALEKTLAQDVLDDLVRLCDGDPLVTQVLIQQSKNQDLVPGRAQFVETIQDPLGRVLKEWYDRAVSAASDSAKPTLYSLVGAMMKARGPMTRNDLAIVANASSGQVDEALGFLKSIVAGNVREGYGFVHQHMGEVLASLLGPVDRNIDEGFLRLLQDALRQASHDAANVPLYALRHAAAHLAVPATTERLLEDFLSPTWLRAHRARFSHVRGFVAITTVARRFARTKNVDAAASGNFPPMAPLDFASIFWQVVADECINIKIGREPHQEESPVLILARVREGLYPNPDGLPPPNAPEDELATLLDIRDRLDSELIEEWHALTQVAADTVMDCLFSYRIRHPDRAIGLLEHARIEFDLFEHIRTLGDKGRRLAGWEYLIENGRMTNPEVAIADIRAIASSTTSLAVRAEAAVCLGKMKELSFEEAFQEVLAFAGSDYQAAKSAAMMVVALLDLPADQRGAAQFEEILHRFRMSVHDDGVEAPVLGAILRHCERNQRANFWKRVRQLKYWSHVEMAIEHGPKDWTKDEINVFTKLFGGATGPPPDNSLGRPQLEKDANSSWRHYTAIGSVLVELARQSNGQARYAAVERVLDNLDRIPPEHWWGEPAGVLNEVLFFARYDEFCASKTRVRADRLADQYESHHDSPLSSLGMPRRFFDLSDADAATEIIAHINRWGEDGLKRMTYHLEHASTGFAEAVLAALETVIKPHLRRRIAELFLANKKMHGSLRDMVAARSGLPNPGQEAWRSWIHRDRKQFCVLLNAICEVDAGSVASAIRWLLNAGFEGQALLVRLNMPAGWPIPLELAQRLRPVLQNWTSTQNSSDFPAALAAHMPSTFLAEMFTQILTDGGTDALAMTADVLQAVQSLENSRGVEKAYLDAVAKSPHSGHHWLITIPKIIPFIADPTKWLTCRLSQLREQENFSESDVLGQIALDALRLNNPNLRETFNHWVLERLEIISNPVERARIRYSLGQTPKQDEVDFCRQLVAKHLDDPDMKYEVTPLFPIVIETDHDGVLRARINDYVSEVDEDDFDFIIKSLGDAINVENVRATIPIALRRMTFTGASRPSDTYFQCLPDDERDAAIQIWHMELRERGIQEDERRFLRNIAELVGSPLARELLELLLGPATDHLFWKEVILSLVARLLPEDADALVIHVMAVTKTTEQGDIAIALVARLRPHNRREVLADTLAVLSSDVGNEVLSWFCCAYPELATANIINDALHAAETYSHLPVEWINDAPSASMAHRDRVWAIMLTRAEGTNISTAFARLADAIRFLRANGVIDKRVIDWIMDGRSVIEESFVG